MTPLPVMCQPSADRNSEDTDLPGISSDNPGSPVDESDSWMIDHGLLSSLSPAGCDFVAAVLETNAHSGRAARVIGKMRARRQVFMQFWDGEIAFSPDLTWAELWAAYQHRVLFVFKADSERILAWHHRGEQAWRTLMHELTGKAIRSLVRVGFSLECACDKAAEMAQETCERALAHAYPCDVPVDYWLYAILRNINLQVWTRSQDMLDRDPTISSLDELEDMGICIAARSFMCAAANHGATDPSHSSTQMDALIHAINQIQSMERRQVVAYTYFADMTDDEIAAHLHKSKAVVHILRHRALKQLRSLIEE